MMRHIAACVLLICALFGAFALPARADGKFFQTIAVQEEPRIPSQRAVVRYKDGKLTLVIQSTVNSASKDLGWVIPLPAVPEKMEKVEPGLRESMAFVLGPKVVDDANMGGAFIFIVLLIIATCWALGGPLRRVVGLTLFGTLIFAIALAISIPNNLAAAQASIAGGSNDITIATEVRIGSYDAKVLTARTPEALDAWLAQNGFASLSVAEKQAVREYIDSGWCFFTAHLARSNNGSGVPHPIRFEMTTPKPVYPMKLTTLSASEPIYLDLFIIGEQTASAPGLSEVLCQTFKNEQGYDWTAQDKIEIGHPALEGLFWQGCTVTRLSGQWTPGAKTDDISLAWKPFTPYHQILRTKRGAISLAVSLAIWAAVASLSILMVLRRRDFGPQGHRARAAAGIMVALVPAVCVGCIAYATIPVAEGVAVKRIRIPYQTTRWSSLMITLDEMNERGELGLYEPALQRIRAAIKAEPKLQIDNVFLGGPIREECSPGNYYIDKSAGDRLALYTYDMWARPRLVWCQTTVKKTSTP